VIRFRGHFTGLAGKQEVLSLKNMGAGRTFQGRPSAPGVGHHEERRGRGPPSPRSCGLLEAQGVGPHRPPSARKTGCRRCGTYSTGVGRAIRVSREGVGRGWSERGVPGRLVHDLRRTAVRCDGWAGRPSLDGWR